MTDKKAARERIITKIRALLSMTEERGASENEAVKAAEMAARLMAEYDLCADDLRDDTDIHERYRKTEPELASALIRVMQAICELSGVKVYGDWTDPSETFMFGLPHDVEVADYLTGICERAMINELEKQRAEWILFTPRRRSKLEYSFLEGMSSRLAQKIKVIAWTRHRETSGSLTPMKDKLIEEALEKRKIVVRNERGWRQGEIDHSAYASGSRAAEKVQLAAGINADSEAKSPRSLAHNQRRGSA